LCERKRSKKRWNRENLGEEEALQTVDEADLVEPVERKDVKEEE
jgi:hypothetical protein